MMEFLVKSERLKKAREKTLPEPDPCPITKVLIERLAAKVEGDGEPEGDPIS